jgi:uncharacterized protein YutE (UPF0331/DUF86 family)
MTTGAVDLKRVEEKLGYVEECLRALRTLPVASLEEFLADLRNPAAAESLLRRGLEALLDIARHLLAKGTGERTLEYAEVARLAGRRSLVLDPATREKFVQMGGYRNRMTHDYGEVTAEELYRIVRDELADVELVAEELRQAAIRLGRPRR